jgi:hypothetical protein
MGHVENAIHCCTPVLSMVMCFFAKALLGNSCLYLLIKNPLPPENVVSLFVSRLLPNNGSTRYSNILMTDLGRCQDSAVGIATGYGLDDWGIGVWVSVRAIFFPLVVHTSSGAHPTPYPMGTRGSFPGVKWTGRETDHSPPTSAKNTWICISTPP